MRRIVALLMVVLPAKARRLLATTVLGWDIHPTAHIGRSIILAQHVTMGAESSIGSRNVIRNLEELRLGNGAHIATRNWIAAPPGAHIAFPSPNRSSSLVMGDWSMITIGHEIDCSDRVVIGDYAGLIGFRCQILTHSLDLVRDRQITGPVEIGHHTGVMSGSILLSGTNVPACCIVSAGSVVSTKLSKERTLYRGNPAEAVRDLPDLKVFQRGPAEARFQFTGQAELEL
jgi:acetyltransferase-like isoleucine patch superfamily enzyme